MTSAHTRAFEFPQRPGCRCSRPDVDLQGMFTSRSLALQALVSLMKPLTFVLVFILAASAPSAAQSPSPVNFANLAARTDSFVVMIQGNALGFQRTTVERTETGLRMIDDVQIGPIMTQHTEVEFAP